MSSCVEKVCSPETSSLALPGCRGRAPGLEDRGSCQPAPLLLLLLLLLRLSGKLDGAAFPCCSIPPGGDDPLDRSCAWPPVMPDLTCCALSPSPAGGEFQRGRPETVCVGEGSGMLWCFR